MKALQKNKTKVYGGIVAVGFVIAIVAVFVGRADTGVIDVSGAIKNSNANVKDGITDGVIVPVPQRNPLADQPNGGLVGTGKKTLPPSPAVESASTTADTASTTDTGTDADVDAGEGDKIVDGEITKNSIDIKNEAENVVESSGTVTEKSDAE